MTQLTPPPPSSSLSLSTSTTLKDKSSHHTLTRGPILAQYTVHVAPAPPLSSPHLPPTHPANLSALKTLLVLQFPNRKKDQPFKADWDQKPLALRIKPTAGLVEIDIPVHRRKLYDRRRGKLFGRALKESPVLAGGGSYGIAGGFGISGGAGRGRKGKGKVEGGGEGKGKGEGSGSKMEVDGKDEEGEEEELMDRMTLSGRVQVVRKGDPSYAVGVFRDGELHLTRVAAICALQPSPHHLDALAALELSRARKLRDGEGHQPQETQARAVNMSVKKTDDDELDMGEIGQTLRAMQAEKWQSLEWIDQDTTDAYEAYKSNLVVRGDTRHSQVLASMSLGQYLEAISAPQVDLAALGEKVLRSKRETPVAEESFDESTDAESDGQEIMAEVGARMEIDEIR
ncbi:hypothetical protein MMC10_003676 [Thelotrema lepadinum]|nr:hypothetical protein [Thelotrema lepadinum]